MNKGAHYREQAAQARRWEQETDHPELRQQFRRLAESYDELAATIEALEKREDSST